MTCCDLRDFARIFSGLCFLKHLKHEQRGEAGIPDPGLESDRHVDVSSAQVQAAKWLPLSRKLSYDSSYRSRAVTAISLLAPESCFCRAIPKVHELRSGLLRSLMVSDHI